MLGLSGARPSSVVRLSLLLWASSQAGCFLLGYEGIAGSLDAGMTSDTGTTDASELPVNDGAIASDAGEGDLDAGHGDAGTDAGQVVDAGADSGAPPLRDGWWKGTEPTTSCSGLPGAVCTQTCPTTATAPCVFECSAIASCASACEYGSQCYSECGTIANCSHNCNAGAECWYVAKSSYANVTCEYNSVCDVTCPANVGCNVTCVVGASCLLDCSGGLTCNMDCKSGIKASCPDGTVVCDHACP
ncbi:MAG: hypothetical protein QM778_29655 [Myxococcales bacterium]